MKSTLAFVATILILTGPVMAAADQDITIPYDAVHGAVTIDADLSDWAGSNWVELDVGYSGDPADITSAKYSVRWDDTTNLLYLAAEVTDTDTTLSDGFSAWNGQDDIEIYVDAGENNNYDMRQEQPPNYYNISNGGQDLAQQIFMGVNLTDQSTGWSLLASAGEPAVDLVPEYAAKRVGDTLFYEISIVPNSYYGQLQDPVEANTVVDLTADETVGLDLVAGTLMTDGTFAMAGNNTVGGKFKYGEAFQTWRLQQGGNLCVVYAAYGDFNCDAKVDLVDLVILGENYNSDPGFCPLYEYGDTNQDCKVDLTDLVTIGENYNTTITIPEPASLGLLAFGALLAIRRR